MVALAEGTRSPNVVLTSLSGKTYNLQEALNSSGPVILAFYKAACPVCQMTLPFVERLARVHPNRSIWAISQDDSDETSDFVLDFALTLPVLLDEALQKSVEFELSNVPSIFLIGIDGRIHQTIVGFDKSQLETLHDTLSQADGAYGAAMSSLLNADDQVPEFRPG